MTRDKARPGPEISDGTLALPLGQTHVVKDTEENGQRADKPMTKPKRRGNSTIAEVMGKWKMENGNCRNKKNQMNKKEKKNGDKDEPE